MTAKATVLVTLELNQSEAETLRAILGRIAGCPYTSYRQDADSVHTALCDVIGRGPVPSTRVKDGYLDMAPK